MGRAQSRQRKRDGLKPKRQPDRADALDIAWRAGARTEDVLQFEIPPMAHDSHSERERRVHPDLRYSSTEDRHTVQLWFRDTREAKTGPETGRTNTRLSVIGSARPWWHAEPMCTRGPAPAMEPFTMGASVNSYR